jgi:glycosyltransferase involved in cell wall biosynthesis
LFKPVYITFHGYEGNEPPTWKAVIHRKLAESAARGAICVGDFMKKWYRATPEIVTYGSAEVTHSAFSRSPLKREILRGDEAVFWGRFDDDTGIYTYIEAVKMLPKIKYLRIYGDGPYKPMVEKESKKSKKLSTYPWSANIETILGTSKYAFVSRYLSIIEAMQARRLVVAVYNNEIKKDYLECHPMCDAMIVAGNADELIQKITSLSEENETRMIEQAYNWAKSKTWKYMADEYERLWKM